MGKTNKPRGQVAKVFEEFPKRARTMLLDIRNLIFETASEQERVGPITETLKWGQPAYLTEESKSGSTIRLGWRSSSPNQCAILFICTTTLVTDFRSVFGNDLEFEGNRAVVLDLNKPYSRSAVKSCIAAALTYHGK